MPTWPFEIHAALEHRSHPPGSVVGPGCGQLDQRAGRTGCALNERENGAHTEHDGKENEELTTDVFHFVGWLTI